MTTSAWVMLGVTWSVVVFFAGRFFLAVLRKSPDRYEGSGEGDG